MKKYYLGFVAVSVFLLSCADDTRDNPYDERAVNYIGKSSAEGSSSSVETDDYPSSSSEKNLPSSNSVEPSSSSAETSSSSEAASSSSVAPSSSSAVPSSSSAPPSSSGTTPSSSSVGLSSSSALPSSSGTVPSSSSSVPSSSSLGGGYSGSYGSLPYEGHIYKTVVIGTQTWFAENLNYAVSGSKCGNSNGLSDNNTEYCDTYGRLYNWETAKTVCPSGWRLPTKDDWNELSSYVQNTSGCSSCDAKLLKSASGWNSNGNGTDEFGFSALPGGSGYSDGSFGTVGGDGVWWSANENEYGSNVAYGRFMYYDYDIVNGYGNDKSFLRSVRCVQD